MEVSQHLSYQILLCLNAYPGDCYLRVELEEHRPVDRKCEWKFSRVTQPLTHSFSSRNTRGEPSCGGIGAGGVSKTGPALVGPSGRKQWCHSEGPADHSHAQALWLVLKLHEEKVCVLLTSVSPTLTSVTYQSPVNFFAHGGVR